ncbi:MAG: hypothetical protein ACTSUZ_08155 [Candidatus Thorarchaeota archaeon]
MSTETSSVDALVSCLRVGSRLIRGLLPSCFGELESAPFRREEQAYHHLVDEKSVVSPPPRMHRETLYASWNNSNLAMSV